MHQIKLDRQYLKLGIFLENKMAFFYLFHTHGLENLCRQIENEVSPVRTYLLLEFSTLISFNFHNLQNRPFYIFLSNFGAEWTFFIEKWLLCDYPTCHVSFTQFQSMYEYVALVETVSE